jgi:hypothetical protein
MIDAAIIAIAIATAQPGIADAVADRYATDIADFAPDLETGMALVVTAWGESNFRESIERCKCQPWECDDGAAVGLFQLHDRWYETHSQKEICADNRLSTELAAKMMVYLREHTGTFERALRAVRGAAPGDAISLRRIRLYKKLLRAARTVKITQL